MKNKLREKHGNHSSWSVLKHVWKMSCDFSVRAETKKLLATLHIKVFMQSLTSFLWSWIKLPLEASSPNDWWSSVDLRRSPRLAWGSSPLPRYPASSLVPSSIWQLGECDLVGRNPRGKHKEKEWGKHKFHMGMQPAFGCVLISRGRLRL